MRLGFLLALISLAVQAAPMVGAPIALDTRPLTRPDAVHAAAMGDEVLVAWNTLPTGPFTIFLATLLPDGGFRAFTPTSVLGNFAREGVRVAAARSEPLWVVGWPDWGSGGQTGGTRVFTDGGLPDSYGFAWAGRTYSSRMRMASTPTGFRVLENAAGSSAIELIVTPTSLAPQPFVDREKIKTNVFDVATTRDEVFEVWAAGGEGLLVRAELLDGGRVTTTGYPWTPDDLAAAGTVDTLFVLQTVGDGGTSDLWLSRTSPAGLVTEALARPNATHPALASSPARLWMTFVQGGAVHVQRRGDAQAQQVWTGAVARPSVAPIDDDRAWVTWAETTDAGLQAFAAWVDLTPDADAGANDAGVPDAGPVVSADAGSVDAGLSVDAGVLDDAGIANDAGMLVAVVRPKQFSVGCATVEPGGWTLTVWSLVVALRRGVRARSRAAAHTGEADAGRLDDGDGGVRAEHSNHRRHDGGALGRLLPHVPTVCSNLLDDDNDGVSDFPDDPGCQDAADNDEYNPAQCVNTAVQPCDAGVCSGTRTCTNGTWGRCGGCDAGVPLRRWRGG